MGQGFVTRPGKCRRVQTLQQLMSGDQLEIMALGGLEEARPGFFLVVIVFTSLTGLFLSLFFFFFLRVAEQCHTVCAGCLVLLIGRPGIDPRRAGSSPTSTQRRQRPTLLLTALQTLALPATPCVDSF